MAHLHYMALSGISPWPRALTDSGAQLSPYRTYLRTARDALTRRPPVLAWELASRALAKRLDDRLRKRVEDAKKRAAAGKRRRDRHAPREVRDGVWVCLLPPPWNFEVPDSVFEAFLDRQAKVQDRPVGPKDRGVPLLAFDQESRAILLEAAPRPIEPPEVGDDDGDANGSENLRHVGPLLFLVPNTYNLERQLRALDTLESRPTPRMGPLVALTTTAAQWADVVPVDIADNEWVFLDKPTRDGTDEQRRFVRIALGTLDFAILEGPPGSGKTTAICELIAQLARQGKRVLLVASTHVAVDNVLERLLARQDASDDKLVLPVRIGDEENVASDAVRPFVLRRLLQTWHDDIRDFLDDPKGGTPMGASARAELKDAMAKVSKPEESPLAVLLLDSANLVCGTTIGILQHPAIKAARDGHLEPFDVLILDEASKTPFTEFLVPAVLARKWIVVGDVRQLSPYVEETDLAENLRGLLQPDAADAAAYSFVAKTKPALVAVKDADTSVRLAAEAEARDVRYVDLDRHEPSEPVLDLLHAQLVFGSAASIRAFEHRLPGELVVTNADVPELPAWEARRSALASSKWKIVPEDEPADWASEVAWRLVRSYELRQNAEEKARYTRDLDALFPSELPEEDRAQLRRRLDTVRRVSMPSILELLQRGFERLPDKPDFGVALTDGLPPRALASRLVSLSFHHRMHPDISAFPRARFYTDRDGDRALVEQVRSVVGEQGLVEIRDGDPGQLLSWRFGVTTEALARARSVLRGESGLLRDASTVAAERTWTYGRYRGGRAVWMNVHPDARRHQHGNRNPAEARRVIGELEAFVAWARDNAKRDGPWEVAVLTYYRGQEAVLRERLQDLSGLEGNTRNFTLPRDVPPERRPVHVTLCTVDRFQGHEADLVLLSFVKTGSVGFLNSPNRLNVALTRSRFQLVLVGDREFFRSDDCRSPLLRELASTDLYPADLTWEQKP